MLFLLNAAITEHSNRELGISGYASGFQLCIDLGLGESGLLTIYRRIVGECKKRFV